MTITNLKWRDPCAMRLLKGQRVSGFQEIQITTVLIRKGTSYVQRTSTGKLRMSAARAFLKPARKRKICM